MECRSGLMNVDGRVIAENLGLKREISGTSGALFHEGVEYAAFSGKTPLGALLR